MEKRLFKSYTPNQLQLLPPSWDERIEAKHPVRIVNHIIDHLDLKELYACYEGGGAPAYHPKLLLKALVYGYMQNIYSSRKIEEAIKSNIYFIWLCGETVPDHNTINRFRGKTIAPILKDIFKQIVVLLAEEGLVSLQDLYIDGTKIEANANRYSFVWGKAVKTNKEKIVKQLEELWQYAQTVASKELGDTAPIEYATIDPEKVEQTIARIEEAIKDRVVPKKITQKLTYAKKKYPEKIAEYARKEQLLGGRNSYSKTDTDATFMRMKEDHMRNGQLKPGYNIQLSTNNQIIVNYDSYPNPTDTLTFSPHLASFQKLYGSVPEMVTSDGGYGSEANYRYAEEHGITAYVKYNTFDQEHGTARRKRHPFAQDQLHYNQQEDYYVCPMGQRMVNVGTSIKRTAGGFEQHLTHYQAQRCHGCPVRGVCHRSQDDRTITVNHSLNAFKRQARDRLLSDEGIVHRKKRGVEIESVFGNIKQNKGFRRFMLRGKTKTLTEVGLLAIAHNLRKKAA
jgi:transposase